MGNQVSNEELMTYLLDRLTVIEPEDPRDVAKKLQGNKTFDTLNTVISELRILTTALNHGQLDEMVKSKGYVLANLKALQANLRHLTWQTKKIAQGDFSQKVDFMGAFSHSFNEMTALLEASGKKLEQMALTDPLTQLSNRYHLNAFLERHFNTCLMTAQPFCVLLMDIDYFKAVNDMYGHTAGDKVLVKLGEILKAQLQKGDMVARYGGEEFLMVLVDTGIEAGLIRADKMRAEIGKMKIELEENASIQITVSVGISQNTAEDQQYEDVIKRSDNALYLAKRGGRNRCVIA